MLESTTDPNSSFIGRETSNFAIKTKIQEIVRDASLSRMRRQALCDEIELLPLPNLKSGQVLGRWMALILISGKTLRVTFKVHFRYRDAKSLASRKLAENSSLTDQDAVDFIKEYCNLTAGYLKTALEECGIHLGISLSLCTRGYYEVFSNQSEVSELDAWILDSGSNQIACSTLVESYDFDVLNEVLDYNLGDKEEASGELELF